MREKVTASGIDGQPLSRCYVSRETGLRIQTGSGYDTPERIDDSADSGCRRSQKISAVFHGTNGGHGKMLEGRGTGSVPAVICDRDEKLSTLFYEAANLVGKDDLVAYGGGERNSAVFMQNPGISGRQLTDSMRKIGDEAENKRVWSVFAERNEVHFVIAGPAEIGAEANGGIRV